MLSTQPFHADLLLIPDSWTKGLGLFWATQAPAEGADGGLHTMPADKQVLHQPRKLQFFKTFAIALRIAVLSAFLDDAH